MDDDPIIDPLLRIEVKVQVVHPFQAIKSYICPGCENEIARRVGHVVVVPIEAVELRRHWHTACWKRRATRRPGR